MKEKTMEEKIKKLRKQKIKSLKEQIEGMKEWINSEVEQGSIEMVVFLKYLLKKHEKQLSELTVDATHRDSKRILVFEPVYRRK